jgi:hypothetical protein
VRVRSGKLHKVLHLKRPHLYPILDSQLRRTYRTKAKLAGAQLARHGQPSRPAYWAAIRDDLLANALALRQLRDQLVEDPELERLAGLSDLRLLDILAWSLTAPPIRQAEVPRGAPGDASLRERHRVRPAAPHVPKGWHPGHERPGASQ